MRFFIKYISLLLFSGLILPCYQTGINHMHAVEKAKKAISKTTSKAFTINTILYQDIAEILFPALKR